MRRLTGALLGGIDPENCTRNQQMVWKNSVMQETCEWSTRQSSFLPPPEVNKRRSRLICNITPGLGRRVFTILPHVELWPPRLGEAGPSKSETSDVRISAATQPTEPPVPVSTTSIKYQPCWMEEG